MFLENGHLRAWYFHDPSDYVWDHGLGIDGGAIADGQWHHVALVVDGTSGRLYVDGAQTGFLNWFNSPGATTTPEPLQIGKYYNYPNTLLGLADEVSVWNVALTPAQLNACKNAPLTGSENGLVALWRFNEGTGPTAGDLTSNGHDGSLMNGPVWTGSTAFLGDGTSAIHTTTGFVQWTRQFAVNTIPAQQGFAALAPFWVRRLDDFGAPGGNTSVSVTLQSALQSAALGGPEMLVNNSSNITLSLGPYLAAAPQASAGGSVQQPVLDVEPAPGVQLDSVNDTFQLGVAESYSVNSGPALTVETNTLAFTPLLHFDGHLFFGPVDTIFTALAASPVRGLPSGGGIAAPLNVLTAYVVSKPDHVYGSGLAINAVLLSDGDAMASGTINLVAPVPDTDTIQNISYARATETLGPGGASASVAVNLPLGFSVGSDPTNHLTSGSAPCGTLNLDANLQPTNTSVVMAGPLYAVEETLPYCFVAPSLTWMITSGQIVLSPSSGVFARQDADDKLTAAAPGLTEPNTANRISNDGYFRNATPAGSSLIVTADANGVAHVATQLSLNPPELRPHFPYTSSAPGSEIPTGPGPLIITDNLADPASYLTLTGPAPVAYGRDCTYTGCTAALAGPAQLNFTPGSGQLNFTPDGGLLAYGSVPPDNLQWGYATGGNFAQQAGQVGGAAFVMAGTFLRADQTALPDPERASVLLFSGFGDAADPSYSERPGLAGYNDGFANYPGLNFRSPTQGQSYVGQHDSGVYSLRPRLQVLCSLWRRQRHPPGAGRHFPRQPQPLRL